MAESTQTKGMGKVALELRESGVAVLRLGAVGESVVTFTKERMDSLYEAVENVQRSRPAGLIITGPQEEMFCAGADLNLIRDVKDAPTAEALARRGQDVFDLIEQLPFPTVAAISGPCVGGGCELALACKVRLISDHKSSAIGLPEIKLGILPGFGGTQRLPRLVGLPKALEIILAGKILRPQQALRAGLVNEIIAPHGLLARAESIAAGSAAARPVALRLTDKLLTFTKIGRSTVRRKALAKVMHDTKGFYPAPPAALECAVHGLNNGIQAGLERERKEIGRLLISPESKALVRLFFLTETSKSIGKGARKATEQLHSVVVGAGVMGAGIAGALARAECQVILKDTSDTAVNRGMEQIKKHISKLSYLTEQERSFILNRIEPTTRDSANLGNTTLAIEAVFEDLAIKKKILSDLSALMPPDAILASNTSSLPVTEIAAAIPQPERVVGMHFFNPVEKMQLVEIVRGARTSDKTVAIVAALTTKLGKYPIVVNDVPGFLVNRILTPYLAEAAQLLADGYSIADIDRAATAFGMPMGPIRLLDEVGLDVASHVSEIMIKAYGDRMKGPGFASKLVSVNRKGKKSGGGFYDFKDGEEQPHEGIRQILEISKEPRTADAKLIQNRLITRLLGEAVLCFDEGVAGAPSQEAAHQVDLGSVMGFGFPPFKGGVLFYANSLGAKNLVATFEQLEKECGPRFACPPGVKSRAANGRSFFEAP